MITPPYALFLFFVFLGVIACVPLLINQVMAPKQSSHEKTMPYECGLPVEPASHSPYFVRYFFIAILFLLFELEMMFLFLWALVAPTLGTLSLVCIGVFLSWMVLGFVYEWSKGVFQ